MCLQLPFSSCCRCPILIIQTFIYAFLTQRKRKVSTEAAWHAESFLFSTSTGTQFKISVHDTSDWLSQKRKSLLFNIFPKEETWSQGVKNKANTKVTRKAGCAATFGKSGGHGEPPWVFYHGWKILRQMSHQRRDSALWWDGYISCLESWETVCSFVSSLLIL